MRARITCKSKQTDIDSRIGAFEVQVAFRNSKGEILTELLHSKLLSRHWPSRSVMEKKLKAFILTSGIAVHPLYDPNSHSDGIGLDGLGPYPTGFVEWEETPLAETFWVFPAAGYTPLPAFASAPTPLEMLRNPELVSQIASPTPLVPRKKTGGFINLNCNMANVENIENKSLAVQWVFDARSVHGIVAKPPVIHQAIPPPSEPTLKRRPLSASATKPASASNLAKVCAKQLSPRSSEKTCSTASDETEEAEPQKYDDSADHESISCIKSTSDELKAVLCKNVSKGRENMPSIPYVGALLISKGIVAAETIACCTLLRRAIISLCISKHSANHVATAASASIDVAAIFDSLDRQKSGALHIADIDAILTLLQNREPSALATRLVMLSIGKMNMITFRLPIFFMI